MAGGMGNSSTNGSFSLKTVCINGELDKRIIYGKGNMHGTINYKLKFSGSI